MSDIIFVNPLILDNSLLPLLPSSLLLALFDVILANLPASTSGFPSSISPYSPCYCASASPSNLRRFDLFSPPRPVSHPWAATSSDPRYMPFMHDGFRSCSAQSILALSTPSPPLPKLKEVHHRSSALAFCYEPCGFAQDAFRLFAWDFSCHAAPTVIQLSTLKSRQRSNTRHLALIIIDVMYTSALVRRGPRDAIDGGFFFHGVARRIPTEGPNERKTTRDGSRGK